MPEKSVREMSQWELMNHSLQARVLRATIMGALVLGLVTLAVGLGLYISSLVDRLIGESFSTARSAAAIIEKVVDAEKLSNDVMSVYNTLSEDTLKASGSEEYSSLFSSVTESSDYKMMFSILSEFKSSSDLFDIYFAYYDAENLRIVYICDPDISASTGCLPGEWESVEKKEISKFYHWNGTDRLYDIGNTEKYGYMCTSGIPLKNKSGEVIGFILADVTLNEVFTGLKSYLIQFSIALLLVLIVVGAMMSRHMKKELVDPINRIAEAAQKYINDRQKGISGKAYFSSLNIHTGDEVENLSLLMADMENSLKSYEKSLTRIVAEREKIDTELALAAKIQEDVLPRECPAFPDRNEFDIYGMMIPAKEVGGDFYDYFLVDDDHLAIVIADVSGKGIPAALFMMATRIIISNHVMMGKTPAEVLEQANNAVCSSNEEEMFVTLWLGILEISTGRLTAANAGHEYPVVTGKDGTFELIKDKHGFVLGGMRDMTYTDYELQLRPQDRLFVYTDGIAEATDASGVLFGTDRMIEALNSDPSASAESILKNVRDAVDRFIDLAPQFDDETMVCLVYNGCDQTEKKITLPADIENLPQMMSFLDDNLEKYGCAKKVQMQIDMAADEIFSNIAGYAYEETKGEAEITFRFDPDQRIVTLTFADSGKPFNPLESGEPDTTLSAQERKIGGLGIFLVRKTMDSMEYERREEKNILRITKKI